MKKILRGVLAALSTPEAVAAEKSLAALVLTRVAILVPSAAFIIDRVVQWLS